MTNRSIVLLLCTAEVLTMAGVFAFPALLPDFMAAWSLTNTEAGWISGITFAGYALAVPVLSALTDRMDAKRVWLAGTAVTALSCLGFAMAADGFWSAALLRALGGIGLAGTYMPGLKALVDRTSGAEQPKWMSWYTASFSLGTSVSFLFAGWVGGLWGWRAAFGLSGVVALVAIVLVAMMLKPAPPHSAAAATALLDFRPVLRDRPVMGYVLGYAAHMWELFALRSWMVAFLAFALVQAPGLGPSPTQAAMLASLVAMAGSIGGASLAVRFERRRTCQMAAMGSALFALCIGFTAGWPYAVVVVLMVVYNGVVQLDSAALTTGAVLESDPSRRGATIAVHSLIGFAAAFVGPLAFGAVLDLAGGQGEIIAWGLAFTSVAVVGVLGVPALRWSRLSPPAPPDRSGT